MLPDSRSSWPPRSSSPPEVSKIPDLFGPLGAGIGGQIAAGSAASFICAYLSVQFLDKYFRTRTLIPFAVYSLAAGATAFLILAMR